MTNTKTEEYLMDKNIIQDDKLTHAEIKIGMDTNEKLIVTKHKKECRPLFWMVNKGARRRCMEDVEQLNSLKMITMFTDAEGFAFRIILDNLRPAKSLNGELYTTCHLTIDRTSMTPSDKVRLSKGLSQLIKRDLLIKTGRSSYMLNPLFILPQYQEAEYNEWQNRRTNG